MVSKLHRHPVKACANCGSSDLSWASGGSNAMIDSLGGTNVGLVQCQNCGKQGMPVQFNTDPERKDFEKRRSRNVRPISAQAAKTPAIGAARLDLSVIAVFTLLCGIVLLWQGLLLAGAVALASAAFCGFLILRR